MKEAVYRVAQEAMHTVAKHGRAQIVDVELNTSDGVLQLVVADNGRGFDPSHEFPGHLGLKSMHERVAAIVGTLEIQSAPGAGTRVCLTLPLTTTTTGPKV
jgi:signal transduction histidine kinase